VVDTDSPVILAGLEKNYPSVVRLERPHHLRAGTIPMNEILMHDTDMVPADLYLQTHSTNPLLRAATISRAIQTFVAGFPAHDSLFSVTRLQTRLYDQQGRPLNHDPNVLLQTQDLPPVFEENSCIYLFTRENLQRRHNRLGERPMLFEIDADEAWDIDEELDFSITEFLMKRRTR
jgi:CMP-N-acetylneuraminic acid synthetase